MFVFDDFTCFLFHISGKSNTTHRKVRKSDEKELWISLSFSLLNLKKNFFTLEDYARTQKFEWKKWYKPTFFILRYNILTIFSGYQEINS